MPTSWSGDDQRAEVALLPAADPKVLLEATHQNGVRISLTLCTFEFTPERGGGTRLS